MTNRISWQLRPISVHYRIVHSSSQTMNSFFRTLVCSVMIGLAGSVASQPARAARAVESNTGPPYPLVLMCISAHPDDEDGATLAYYAKLKGVKTYTVFFTR